MVLVPRIRKRASERDEMAKLKKRTPVIAYHLVWTGYGCWLPNDPRGSGSQIVRHDVLRDLGEVHHGRKRIQPPGHVIREFYNAAKPRLRFPVLSFDDRQIALIAESFDDVIRRRYTCYAGAIMADHVHLLIRKHRDQAEEMIARLQAASRLRLIEDGRVDPDHRVWIEGGWRVYLETPADVRRTINYIERNPRVPQQWPFVTQYDNWPFHKKMRPSAK